MARRKRPPTADDLELWEKVAETTVPLHPKPLRKPAEESVVITRPNPQSAAAQPTDPPKMTVVVEPRTAISELSDNQSIRMDRRRFDNLRKGKLRPEARLDLHGLTAEVAHQRLQSFIAAAHRDGLRLTLVITGKGKISADEPGHFHSRRGVLRHSVPHWLAQPRLRQLILQVTQAHDSHGGAGALYVYLRRQR